MNLQMIPPPTTTMTTTTFRSLNPCLCGQSQERAPNRAQSELALLSWWKTTTLTRTRIRTVTVLAVTRPKTASVVATEVMVILLLVLIRMGRRYLASTPSLTLPLKHPQRLLHLVETLLEDCLTCHQSPNRKNCFRAVPTTRTATATATLTRMMTRAATVTTAIALVYCKLATPKTTWTLSWVKCQSRTLSLTLHKERQGLDLKEAVRAQFQPHVLRMLVVQVIRRGS